MRLSHWKDVKNRSLPELLVISREIQRQVKTEAEAEAITDFGNTVFKGLTSVSISCSILKNFLKVSLNKLWGAINSSQVAAQMALMKNVKFPAIAAIF